MYMQLAKIASPPVFCTQQGSALYLVLSQNDNFNEHTHTLACVYYTKQLDYELKISIA